MFTGKFSLFFLLVIISLLACKNEPNQNAPEFAEALLHGRWEIREAWRNGKPTETLAGTFYEFNNSGKMKTNLTESLMEEEFDYKFSDNIIAQKSEPEETQFTVEALSDSSLVMSTAIRNIPFRFTFQKAVPPVDSSGIIQ